MFITKHPIQFSFIRKINQRILQLVNKRKLPTLTGLLAIPIPIEIFRFKLLTVCQFEVLKSYVNNCLVKAFSNHSLIQQVSTWKFFTTGRWKPEKFILMLMNWSNFIRNYWGGLGKNLYIFWCSRFHLSLSSRYLVVLTNTAVFQDCHF